MSDQSGRPAREPFPCVVVRAAGIARGADRLFAAARDAGWEVGAPRHPRPRPRPSR
ncbi:hypothetical protein [Streptomyces sp. NPDC017524]|uniref:hypothetical protein n=1 Tax=Streptomyces sp. NPDC017524 TaxID=3364999 RepID=UPI00379A8915